MKILLLGGLNTSAEYMYGGPGSSSNAEIGGGAISSSISLRGGYFGSSNAEIGGESAALFS